MSESKRLEINWFRVAGSALGAVSGAVVLSTLGAVGTLVGAALSSLFITAGGAVYSHTLKRTKERVAPSGLGARRTRGQTTTSDSRDRDTGSLDEPDEDADDAESEAAPVKESWRQVVRELPWKRIAGLSVGLFVVAVAIILVFELSTGRPVSYYTGGSPSSSTGTSIPGLGGRGGDPGPTAPEEEPPQRDQTPKDQTPRDEPTPKDQTPQDDESPQPDQDHVPPQDEAPEAPEQPES